MAIGDLVNAQLGNYQVVELHAAGGVAEVYQARHLQSEQQVAIKVMREELAKDKVLIKAFESEFAILQDIEHSCVPKAYRLETLKDRRCMLLEFVDGPTVQQLKQGEQRFDRLGTWLALINGTAAIHNQGYVHNDLKLENVILRPSGKLALVDFGNARSIGGKSLFGKLFGGNRAIFGTANYMAPEVITGDEPTTASDSYALGICAHVLLAGAAPFADERRSVQLHKAVKLKPPSILSKVPKLPRGLGQIIDRCLQKEPEMRPQDAVELKNMIRRFFGDGMAAKVQELTAIVS